MARLVLGSIACLLLVAPFVQASQITPVQKVVQMVSEMRAKGDEEMKAEEVTFTTFAMWCENTARQRNEAITKGEASISRLSAEIDKLGNDARVLGDDIQKLDALIDQTTKETAAANKQRTGEHEDYEVEDAEIKKTVKDVHAAGEEIKRMMSSSPGASAASLIQEVAAKHRLPNSARRTLMAFLEQKSSIEDSMAGPEAGSFESQSGQIGDVVVGLENKFGEEQEDGWKEEAEAKHAFSMLAQTLTDQNERQKHNRNTKASTKKNKEKGSAEAKGELAETTATRDADTAYLADLKATCEQKTADFKARQELRAGELEAIDKAIEILSSDAVSGSADKHLPAMIQKGDAPTLAQLRNGERMPSQSAAAAFLELQGKRIHSPTLSAISMRVSTDPFKKVTKMIKDMVYKLQEEATDEAEHKGFCDTELATNKQSRDSLTAQADELNAEIEELTSKSNKLAMEIGQLSQQISELDASVAEATSIRAEEKEKNTATVADAKGAIGAVEQATSVLKEFYAKAAGATALTQVQKGVADDMPQTFEKPYTGMANGGVMGMLEVILSDFQRLEAETTQAEDAGAQEFTTFKNDSQLDKAEKDKAVSMKQDSKQQADSNAQSAKSDLDSTQKELNAAMDYFEKLKPSCVDAGIDYDDRVARRKEEIQSLKEALTILTP